MKTKNIGLGHYCDVYDFLWSNKFFQARSMSIIPNNDIKEKVNGELFADDLIEKVECNINYENLWLDMESIGYSRVETDEGHFYFYEDIR